MHPERTPLEAVRRRAVPYGAAPFPADNCCPDRSSGFERGPFCYPARVFDPQMELLLTLLSSVVAVPDSAGLDPQGQAQASWADCQAAAKACGELDEDLEAAIVGEDTDGLRAILEQWLSGKRHLLVHDRDVLKRALKAYRKRLKITVLDAESSVGGGPMSSGRKSEIVGITPPERYPRSVWDELVRQGRLVYARLGMYELPPE